jgi:hypothetical protein
VSEDLVSRPAQVKARLQALRTEINSRFIEIAELLRECYVQEHWRSLGYAGFEEFVEEQLDMSYRKALYLAECFHVLIEKLHVPRADVEALGWSKAKELIPIITEENREHWVEFAKTHTTNETNLAVRQARAPAGQEAFRGYSPMTIGLYDDEREAVEAALELAKREAGTERTGLALMLICEGYKAEAEARHAQLLRQYEETDAGETS